MPTSYLMDHNEISGHVIDAAIKVHKMLGPGLLLGAYRAFLTFLTFELQSRGLRVRTEMPIPWHMVRSGRISDTQLTCSWRNLW